ncbi:hypothetical protein [Lutibaculum baratangense]|uniref:Uncharacterized protein n=1 Tax=Lutibaculum baratangense AMV1 TaxID=631454 RepID=V4RTA0_9HYPH|nr:hypothetical protein [Lutibaculum baratangense]ESR26350.1 hypothetical protein N177_0850 [Lutibaculum baratangense AMV1]
MLRFLARLIGLFLLAGATIAVIVDGATSIGASRIAIVPFGALWIGVAPQSLEAIRLFLVNDLAAWLWDPVFTGFLKLPAFAVLGLFGWLFLALGRRRHDPYEADEER